MPVVHEKTNPRSSERAASRERPLNRTSNRNIKREDSLDRKPIISQEKPSTSRQVKAPLRDKKVAPSQKTSVSKSQPEPRKPIPRVSPPKLSIDKEKSQKTRPEKIVVEKPKRTDSIRKPTQPLPSKSKLLQQAKEREIKQKKSEIKVVGSKSGKTEREAKFNHDRSKTRTLSPSEITILGKLPSAPPKETAQSRDKHNEEEGAIALEQKNGESDDEYEDDFEDYESDFEADSSSSTEEDESNSLLTSDSRTEVVPLTTRPEVPLTSRPEVPLNSKADVPYPVTQNVDETSQVPNEGLSKPTESVQDIERQLDSGSYHMAPHHRRELDEVKTAIQNENRNRHKKDLKEVDEGYEDSYKPLAKRLSGEILDFENAGKRMKQQETQAKALKRGEELSKMITLDAISYSILEIPAVPYDVFMKSFGRTDTAQASAQTNEDDCDEEIQTEIIESSNKWTQMPIEFTHTEYKEGRKFYEFTEEEKLGVGCDKPLEKAEKTEATPINISRLKKFLETAGQRVAIWLEGRSQQVLEDHHQSSELTCCEGKVQLRTTGPDLEVKKPITKISAASGNHTLVLSVQNNNTLGSTIHVWTIFEPSTPLKVLNCQQEITCACFGLGRGYFVFAGATDGSLNLWDLREEPEVHQFYDSMSGRASTYSTVLVGDEESHCSPLVSVVVLKKELNYAKEEFSPTEVCTMDESGLVLIWSVVQHNIAAQKTPFDDQGLAPWGRVRLVRSSFFRITDIVPKSDSTVPGERFLLLDQASQTGSGLFIASSSGRVIHCSTYGSMMKPKYFVPSENSPPSEVISIAVNLYDDNYLLIGCKDGTIRLHDKRMDYPLINLHWNIADSSTGSAILSIQWLPSRPCLFIVMDATSRIHVWNLAASDIYPQMTIPPSKNQITSFAVLRRKHPKQPGYMVVGRHDASVELHKLKDEFKLNSMESFKKERKMFKRYVSIL